MFEYDKNYDVLFENEKFIQVLCKFHSSVWNEMSVDERYKVVKEFISKYCEILKIDQMKSSKTNEKRYAGSYLDINSTVSVNKEALENSSQWDIMDTLFHELRHNFQHRAIVNNITELEKVDERKINEWKTNFMSSPGGVNNYISVKADNGHLYMYQPVEEDAFKTGLSCTKKSYDIVKGICGEDLEFIKYGIMNKNTIMLYFSDEEVFKENFKKMRKEVFETFKKNNIKYLTERKCVKIAKKILEKDLDDMTMDELCALFSPYVWNRFDVDYKIALIKEYDKRYNDFKKVKVEKVSNSGLKIYGSITLDSDVINTLNNVFSSQFSSRVEAIIKGKEHCDEMLKESLKANMYEHEGKQINYVRDRDNLFLYSIQPYALYEGKIIVEQFRYFKECQNKIYGIDDDSFDSMIDFYDYDKYIPFIEKFYKKSFSKVYSDFVKEMKKKILEVNKRKI